MVAWRRTPPLYRILVARWCSHATVACVWWRADPSHRIVRSMACVYTPQSCLLQSLFPADTISIFRGGEPIGYLTLAFFYSNLHTNLVEQTAFFHSNLYTFYYICLQFGRRYLARSVAGMLLLVSLAKNSVVEQRLAGTNGRLLGF
jgi:hypothetical protein